MIIQILKYVVAIATILTGAVSLFWPTRVLGFTGLDVDSGRGITEIRTILGALFIGLGAAALYFNMPETYKMLGIYTEAFGNSKNVYRIFDRHGFEVEYVEYFFGCASGIEGKKFELPSNSS